MGNASVGKYRNIVTYAKTSIGFFIDMKDKNLYLVTSEECSADRTTYDVAKEAVEAGVDILQLREKGKSQQELLDLGKKLSILCREREVLFIINDDPVLSKEVDADGVHLGQEDLLEYSIDDVRAIVGSSKIIGVSTHSLEQLSQANQKDVDYIAFGPVFQTKTKDYFIGDEDVEKALSLTTKPIIFIGGIDLSNVAGLIEKGVKNIAVIRAITEAEDISERVQVFKKIVEQRV